MQTQQGAPRARRTRLLRLALLALALLTLPLARAVQQPRAVAAAGPTTVYFPITGHNVGGPFLAYWRAHGELPILGYPLTEAITDPASGLTVQYFERARFELHPENAGTPWEVELTLLGSRRAQGRTEPAFAPYPPDSAGDADHAFFPATGHYLGYGFRAFWEAHGGLPVFGYPLSEEFSEDGYTVQYFERARFEWHPENAGTPYEILLGRLGADFAAEQGVDTAASARQEGAPDYDPSLWNAPQSFRLPALMYHRFGDPTSRYQVSYDQFARELDWLQANGYTTVTLAQAYDALAGYGALPAKPVLLTFDDGYASQWDAAMALDARGMKGTFFIITGQLGLTPDQIASLAREGHEIDAHTLRHPDLTTLTPDQLRAELTGPRDYLRALTGQPVDFLAYPYGAYNGPVVAAVQAAGYRGAVAAWGGESWTPDKWWIEPRVEVDGGISLDEFAGYVR